jgi:hypothetical protein
MRQWVDRALGLKAQVRGSGAQEILRRSTPTPHPPNRGFAAQATVVVVQTQSPTHL